MALSLRRKAHPRVPTFRKSRSRCRALRQMMQQNLLQFYTTEKPRRGQQLRSCRRQFWRRMVKRAYGISKDNYFPRLSLQKRCNLLGKCLGAEWPAKIGGAPFRLGDCGVKRALDARGSLRKARVVASLAEPGEQHRGGAD